jgi:hypothetical protein
MGNKSALCCLLLQTRYKTIVQRLMRVTCFQDDAPWPDLCGTAHALGWLTWTATNLVLVQYIGTWKAFCQPCLSAIRGRNWQKEKHWESCNSKN